MRRKVLGMRPGHAVHRDLGEIVEGREPVVVGIVFGRAVRHLDEQPARPLDHQRQRMMRGDQMRVDRQPQHAQAVLQIMLPDRLVPFEQLLAAPDVVDEDVEPALLGADALDQRCARRRQRDDRPGPRCPCRRPPSPARPFPRSSRAACIRIAGRASCGRSRRRSRPRRPVRRRFRGRRRALRLRPARPFLASVIGISPGITSSAGWHSPRSIIYK